MSDKPKIFEGQIKARASTKSFSRGMTYFHDGSISSPVRRQDEIEGYCEGSYTVPYRVWAKFHDDMIVATTCTCEYDWGGDCKHIVALLLTYIHYPEQFEEKPPLHDALMKLNKATLVRIIERMVIRHPDLQDIIDRPISANTINLDIYRDE